MSRFRGVAVTIVRPDGTVDGGVGYECEKCGFFQGHGPRFMLKRAPERCPICDTDAGIDMSEPPRRAAAR
jgi:rubrerythrin